ncbi:MAG: hypothetical protein HY000_19365, partial [Planctomycetes bacterium]|nr:hypothetical protein [Planctomycetota bacterium]
MKYWKSPLLLAGLAFGGGLLALAGGPEEWYHRDGPLAGSLKSDSPLPIYDPDPQHLWNRLFAALYIRPGENPPPGQPRRIEGGDAYLDALLWPDTTRFSEPAVIDKTTRLLDD